MDLRVWMVGAMRAVDRSEDKGLYISLPADRNVLTGLDGTDQTTQNAFEAREGQSPGFCTALCV